MHAAAAGGPDPSNLQGNGIGGFNKPHQLLVFLQFSDPESGRAFVGEMAEVVTTTATVLDWKAEYRERYPKDSGERHPDPTGEIQTGWLNLVLSFAGLRFLEADELDAFPADFSEGMAAARDRIGDVDESDPSGWIAPFASPSDLHAMVIIAADSPEILGEELEKLRERESAHQVTELRPGPQVGANLTGDQAGHEHFGFKDGISQPAVKGFPGDDPIEPGEFVVGYPKQGGGDPGTFPAWARDGSYVVYRRLRQDVPGFRTFLEQAVGGLGLSKEELGASLVGRYKSGAPLETIKGEADPGAALPPDSPERIKDDVINDFEYEPHDADGHLVPHAAHIRKTYPRNAFPGEEESDRRRILRRGIPYGEFLPEADGGEGGPGPEDDRGLLFLCYQSSITDQFEFIQQTWVNNPGFPPTSTGEMAGRDPIVSQDVVDPQFHLPRESTTLTLARWVITTGGEYFFSPSIAGLRHLAGQA